LPSVRCLTRRSIDSSSMPLRLDRPCRFHSRHGFTSRLCSARVETHTTGSSLLDRSLMRRASCAVLLQGMCTGCRPISDAHRPRVSRALELVLARVEQQFLEGHGLRLAVRRRQLRQLRAQPPAQLRVHRHERRLRQRSNGLSGASGSLGWHCASMRTQFVHHASALCAQPAAMYPCCAGTSRAHEPKLVCCPNQSPQNARLLQRNEVIAGGPARRRSRR